MPRAPPKGTHRESTASSTNDAFDKLLDTARLIEHRGAFKRSEAKRVVDTFRFLGSQQALNNMSIRHQNYHNFLHNIEEVGGASVVALSAAGLGSAAVYCMSDRNRIQLAYKIRERINDLVNPVLQRLANEYSSSAQYAGAIPNTGRPQEGMLQSRLRFWFVKLTISTRAITLRGGGSFWFSHSKFTTGTSS
ncbi:uncharacterized protein BJX67DRAFT_335602 [Aspergillus lucknowensis]|uniref:Uncharacterized protein n=1 Tax=Aspergillus lucknowensis TaxID=176173 RepID=A0ABR4L614_9EURO